VAWFPGQVALAEGELDLVVKGVLGADMGALGIGIGTDGAEALESGQNALWGGQDGNGIRLEACAGCVTGFELAGENQGREGLLLLFWQGELCAEKDLGRPASGECHERHAQGGVALRLEEVCGGSDEGLRIERDQIGLVLVDLFLVSLAMPAPGLSALFVVSGIWFII
jgi:hypothetical protein